MIMSIFPLFSELDIRACRDYTPLDLPLAFYALNLGSNLDSLRASDGGTRYGPLGFFCTIGCKLLDVFRDIFDGILRLVYFYTYGTCGLRFLVVDCRHLEDGRACNEFFVR